MKPVAMSLKHEKAVLGACRAAPEAGDCSISFYISEAGADVQEQVFLN
jgi:hypothetical protein